MEPFSKDFAEPLYLLLVPHAINIYAVWCEYSSKGYILKAFPKGNLQCREYWAIMQVGQKWDDAYITNTDRILIMINFCGKKNKQKTKK